MSVRDDDTELDALAAQVRAHPKLSAGAVDALIAAAAGGDRDARAHLVEQSLAPVLAESLARRGRGVEVLDLFQEGSLAALVAVEEYVVREGAGAGLIPYVRRLVGRHLDRVLEAHEAAVAEAAALVEDTRLLDVARVALRRQTGREATETELGAVLLWSPERVALVAGMLAGAREEFDSDIVQYLDDADEDDQGDRYRGGEGE